jgi:hypothetical protein
MVQQRRQQQLALKQDVYPEINPPSKIESKICHSVRQQAITIHGAALTLGSVSVSPAISPLSTLRRNLDMSANLTSSPRSSRGLGEATTGGTLLLSPGTMRRTRSMNGPVVSLEALSRILEDHSIQIASHDLKSIVTALGALDDQQQVRVNGMFEFARHSFVKLVSLEFQPADSSP